MSVLFIYVGFSYMFQLTNFEMCQRTHDPISRRTSINEVSFIFEKLLLQLLFHFGYVKVENTFLIAALFIISLFSFSFYAQEQPDYNQTILKIKFFMRILFLYCNTFLVIAKLINSLFHFNSSILLFILGIPVMLLISFNINQIEIGVNVLSTPLNSQKGVAFLRGILLLQGKIDSIYERSSQLYLKAYAFQTELFCTIKDCPLTKYLQSNDSEEEITFFHQHIDYLFQIGISKSSNDVRLKIMYFLFLIGRVKKKHRALNELEICSQMRNKTLEEEFIIYKYKRHYDEWGDFEFDEDLSLKKNSVLYQNYATHFKSEIARISLLYIDFWSLLYQNHLEHLQDLSRLNVLGTKITSEVKEVQNLYSHLKSLNPFDLEIMKIYFDFLTEILFEYDKALELKNKITSLENTIHPDVDDFSISNFDIHSISKSDKNSFILLDCKPGGKPIILNISLGLCPSFGYSKRELIGKPLEILIPQTVRLAHRKALESAIKIHKKSTRFLCKAERKKGLKERKVFALSKAKYLVPIRIRFFPAQNELNDVFWVIEVNKRVNDNREGNCTVLTNGCFVIENFTENALKMLEINSDIINGINDITLYIKEFNEEYIRMTGERGEFSQREKIALKQRIARSLFKYPVTITWKVYSDLRNTMLNDLDYDDFTKVIRFNLQINEIIINDSLEGYFFRFEKLNPNSINFSNHFFHGASGEINQSFGHLETIMEKPINNKENVFDIKNNYVPSLEKSERFIFDPISFAFKVNKRNESVNKIFYREQALKKLKLEMNDEVTKNKSKLSSEFEYCDDSQSSYEEDNKYEEMSPSLNVSSSLSSSKDNNQKEEIKLNKDYNSYYHVNFSRIKFCVYDFRKRTIIETHYDKKSKVEQAKDVTIEPIETKSNINNKQITSSSSLCKSLEIENDNTEIKDFLLRHIKSSLEKEESQPTIIKLHIISFIVFIFIIANGIIFLLLGNSSLTFINQKLNRIKNSFLLLRYTVLGITTVRELAIINISNISNSYMSIEDNIKNYTDYLVELYTKSIDSIDFLTKSSDDLSPENYEKIFTGLIPINVIESDKTVGIYNLTSISAITKSFTALYEISQLKRDNIIPLNYNVFYFMTNALNSIYLSICNITNIYIVEADKYVDKRKVLVLLVYSGVSLSILLSFFLLNCAVNEVLLRKESYLQVFYEIGNQVIIYTLGKCEAFAKKVNTSQDEEIISSSENNDNQSLGEEDLIRDDFDKHNFKNNTKRLGRKGGKLSKEELMMKGFIFLFLFLPIIYILTFFIIINKFCNDVKTYNELYINENFLNLEMLMLYASVREFIFNEEVSFNGTSLKEKIDYIFDTFQTNRNMRMEIINSKEDKFYKIFMTEKNKLYENDLCKYIEPFFTQFFLNDKYYNCDHFLFGSIHLGFKVILSTFNEELRNLKGEYTSVRRSSKYSAYSYNLTLYNIKTYSSFLQSIEDETIRKEYEELSPLRLLTDERAQKLEIVSKYLIVPIMNRLLEVLEASIIKELSNKDVLIIIGMSVYISIIPIVYFFCWRRYITSLGTLIYKTKNMLSIIPQEVLVTLKSIHHLLEITTSGIKMPIKKIRTNERKVL